MNLLHTHESILCRKLLNKLIKVVQYSPVNVILQNKRGSYFYLGIHPFRVNGDENDSLEISGDNFHYLRNLADLKGLSTSSPQLRAVPFPITTIIKGFRFDDLIVYTI